MPAAYKVQKVGEKCTFVKCPFVFQAVLCQGTDGATCTVLEYNTGRILRIRLYCFNLLAVFEGQPIDVSHLLDVVDYRGNNCRQAIVQRKIVGAAVAAVARR